jgi:membrane-bound metal-dependent hydrolase YbcI (DUF457 family)
MLVDKYLKLPIDRNPVWLIWFAMFIPDSDFVVQTLWEELSPTNISPLVHGDFHNIGIMIIVSVMLGWFIWKNTKIRYDHAVFAITIGFMAHLMEDALCNGIQYHFYRPFSDQMWWHGFVITPDWDVVYANNVVASWNLIYIGLALLALAMITRTMLMGGDWLLKYNPTPFIRRNLSKIHVPHPAIVMNTLKFYGVIGLDDDIYISPQPEPIPVAVMEVKEDKPKPRRTTGFSKLIFPRIQMMTLTNNRTSDRFDDERFD